MEQIIIKSAPIAISPKKMNLVVSSIRNKELPYLITHLPFFPKKKIGLEFHKLLQGAAKSLAKSKQEIDSFYLDKVEVNQGKTQKRVMYRAKGRTDRIRKRYSLIKLHLSKKESVKINNKNKEK